MSPTILCFKEHSADGMVWWVRHRGKWKTASEVVWADVPMRTVYRGLTSRQPKAYLECECPVTVCGEGGRLVIEVRHPWMEQANAVHRRRAPTRREAR